MITSFVSVRRWALAVSVLLALSASARGETVNAFLTEQTNNNPDANAVGVELNIVDTAGGVQVTATVKEIIGMVLGEGDILAIWFDINPLADLTNITHSAPYVPVNLNITGFVKGHDSIGSAPFGSSGPNINGMPSPFSASTPYDLAIRLGTNGMSPDFYPTASFKLTNLSASDFGASRFAARVTSIGDDNQASGKYAGVGEPLVVPTPTAAMGGTALLALLAIRRQRLWS